MKIVSIEPTPSPYSMKINVDEQLTDGQTENYKLNDDVTHAPDYVQELFTVNGVKGLYRVIDFIALERNPRVPWEEILPEVRTVLGSSEENSDSLTNEAASSDENFGEVKVFIQKFRYIPMQVKLEEGDNEHRFGLPERFMNATMEASVASENMLMERKWVEQSPRYGDVEEIGQEVVDEIEASYDPERVAELVKLAKADETASDQKSAPRKKVTLNMLDKPNWKDRYAALDRMDPIVDDLPVLDKALDDEKASVRRLATAYLGMIEEREVLPYLYKALQDKAVNVRRTAGDCLSDLGFKDAIPEMIKSLTDKSRIVRWRAAMYLYEVGDETAIPALKQALEDPEFEVRMQVKMALARIEDGEEAKGSIWHQMTQATKQK
ncbi:HEAT repeat-containing protein [Virgibacillus subterraneus]|uniref:HEAT repeat-containing protein n=2 Tax=Virgibacillus TaxID=84406 RepID=A0A1H1FMR0_9BACI|nr:MULTISPECIES: conserved virulence factor C family protein [Virgibacillus]SDR02019.1 HEAT repeat-containing protein [Virgibacillus salinus]SEQ72186.1 HEAT repeat-containing protein [Virgibacillus subterraneus]